MIKEELRKMAEKFRLKKADNYCAEPVYETAVSEEMMPAGDGVRLKTVVIRPVTDDPVPVVSIRTCYPGNDEQYRSMGQEFASRGIACVYQYCRGTGGSEGVWEPNVNDRSDGLDMLNNLCERDWVENIGVFGCSYLAFTGWIVADILPEKVKTVYLTHYGTFRHTSAYKDGLFRQDVLTSWAMGNAGKKVDADYLTSARYMPQERVDEDLWGIRLDWYRSWITNTDRSAEYWNSGVWKLLQEIPGRVKVPVYIAEGWYDHHLGSAIETYEALDDEVKKKSVFQIGAWNHGFHPVIFGHKDKIANADNLDQVRAFNWFHSILKEKKEPEGEIRSYVIGADSWYSDSGFRMEHDKKLRLYLGDKGPDGVHTLCRGAGDGAGSCSYIYDPEKPLFTHGAESLLMTAGDQGSHQQPAPDYREDVISFVSEPMDEETILGRIRLCLTVSSDADDTAFTFKVSEVMEDGTAWHIRNGITTLGYRNQSPERISYTPGEKVRIVIDSWHIAWKLGKGSRIRVDVSSSNFPEFALHSNYAGVWSQIEHTRRAKQTIYYGGGDDAYLELPLM